ncbi:MAG: enoyl-CoA hydratase/isomerase family protein [Natronospirillum sp.]|uniref:enoyl-CoA hydratase-related protein n=1 Tax=Natronospirillum sp. TaxID=2812955 RepID=UPI0025DA1EB5|nr:enoyl-CoA hydratase-related protein [Natronospirillum sp.]MCH8550333.1 enoyl-CoA hydratase/isomerase family protein [Natronospirillum sp.]
MSESLLTEQHGPVLVMTLHRPEARNALNTELLAALAGACQEADADEAVRVLLIQGSGEHFAAGADINEIADKTTVDGLTDPRRQYWQTLQALRKPVIAAVEGFCLGGGCELALGADLLVVAEDAKLGQPEVRLGLIPGAGGLQRLAATIGRARAMRLGLTGEQISGQQAFDWGLASHLTPPGQARAEALALAEKLGRGAPLAQQLVKAAVLSATDDLHATGRRQSRSHFEQLLSSADKAEGIAAFRDQRKPDFRGQ